MNNDLWNDVTGSGAVRIAVVGVLAILALFLFAEAISVAGNLGRSAYPPSNTISVDGTGRATAVPDIATIIFSVTESASTVGVAQTAATGKTNKALAFLKEEGIADKDVKTLSYNVSPKYNYPPPCYSGICPNSSRTPTIIGYDVSETIQVKVRDTAKAGVVLEGIGEFGVQNISGPNFTVDDPESVKAEARGEAIADARAKAQTLAKQLGATLGKVVSFSEAGNYPYPMYDKAYGMGVAGSSGTAAPELPTGENEYTANVSITYEIR